MLLSTRRVLTGGQFRSIQIFPKKAALPTGGELPLLVLDVGASSSEGSIFGSSPLGPVDPSRLTYAWYLNGSLEALEDPADGTLVSHDGNNATYTAPRCVPTNNPVNIAVKLSHNQPDVSGPHSKALGLLVRVLARDWTLTASLDDQFKCPLVFADDHVRYESSLSFSIDDNLNVTMRADSIDTREYFGSPTACDKTNVDLARKGDPQMHVGLNSGVYDVDKDVFRLELDWFIPTGLGYDYVTIGNDGSRFPGEFPLGPVVPVVGLEYGVRRGPVPVPRAGPADGSNPVGMGPGAQRERLSLAARAACVPLPPGVVEVGPWFSAGDRIPREPSPRRGWRRRPVSAQLGVEPGELGADLLQHAGVLGRHVAFALDGVELSLALEQARPGVRELFRAIASRAPARKRGFGDHLPPPRPGQAGSQVHVFRLPLKPDFEDGRAA